MNVEKLRKEHGQELKRLRKTKGITQAELAKKISTSVPTIIRMERGKNNFGIDFELRFRAALSVLPDKLPKRKEPSNY